MELYKWYKGDELPDRECDCVVAFKAFVQIGKYMEIYKTCKEIGQCVKVEDKFLFVDQNNDEIHPKRVKAWMPIEFPKEVS